MENTASFEDKIQKLIDDIKARKNNPPSLEESRKNLQRAMILDENGNLDSRFFSEESVLKDKLHRSGVRFDLEYKHYVVSLVLVKETDGSLLIRNKLYREIEINEQQAIEATLRKVEDDLSDFVVYGIQCTTFE